MAITTGRDIVHAAGKKMEKEIRKAHDLYFAVDIFITSIALTLFACLRGASAYFA